MGFIFCSFEEENGVQRRDAIFPRSHMWCVATELGVKLGPVWFSSPGPSFYCFGLL